MKKIIHRCSRGSGEVYDRTFECIQEEGCLLTFKLNATNSYYCESFPVLCCPFCAYKPLDGGEDVRIDLERHPVYDLPSIEEIDNFQKQFPYYDRELCIEILIKEKKHSGNLPEIFR